MLVKGLKPARPKMLVDFTTAHKPLVYTNEKGVLYYTLTNMYTGNIRSIKITNEKLITEKELHIKENKNRQRMRQYEECKKNNCTNKGLRGKERIKCMNKCPKPW